MKCRRAAVRGDGPADKGDGILVTTLLLGDYAGQMQGIGVLGFRLEHAPVQMQRVVQLTTHVASPCLLD